MDEKDEILVIDDDEGTRKTLALILKKKGYDVITAGTGEAGLQQAHGRKIAVALLDINLPDIEGIRLIAPLKEMHPDLAVIMITGFASMENAMRALNEGATGYVLKPVNIDEILSKIHDVLERQHLIKSRQLAEEALRVSEEKYRSLVEDINDVIYSLDERGNITYISPAIEKISGYSPSHLTGHPFAGFIVKEDLPGAMQAFEAGMKGTVTSFPFRVVTKSGEVRWLSVSSYPSFANGNLSGVHGVLSDITERKQAEEAVHAAVTLNRLIDTMSVSESMGYTLDEAERLTNSKIGFFHLINPDEQTIQLIAWSTETKKHCFIPKEPERHYLVEKAGVWVDCMRERKPVIHNDYASLPHRKGLPEGHAPIIRELVVPIFDEDKIVGIIGVGNKATDYDEKDINVLTLLATNAWTLIRRKNAEEALRKSEHRSAMLLEALPDMMFVLSRDGVYRDFSVPDNRALAVPAEQIIGKNIRDVGFNREMADAILHHIAQAIDTNTLRKFEYELMVPQGVRQYEARLVALSGDEVLGIVRDITERKRAEEALNRSEEKFRDIFDKANDAIEIFEIRDNTYPGKYIEVNEVACRMLQYSKEELLQHSPIDFDTTDYSVPPYDELAKKLLTVGNAIFETGHKRKDGKIVPVEVNYHIITLLGQKAGVAIVRDITERKQAEDALRTSEERFRTMIEQSPLSIEVMSPDGRTLQVNPAFVKLWGVTLEDLKDYNMLQDEQLTRLGIMPYIQRGFSGEAVAYPPLEYDGSKTLGFGDKRWVQGNIYPVRDAAGTIRNVILVHEDISEQKKAEEALRESEQKFRQFFNNVNDAIYLHRTNEQGLPGKFLEVNEVMCRRLGYSRDELLSMAPQDILPESGRLKMPAIAAEIAKRGQATFETEHRRKDGSILPVEVSSLILTLGGERVALASARDITERKRAEAALIESEQRFHDIFNNITDAILLHEIGSNGPPGRFTDVNDVACRMLGYTKEELLAKTPLDITTDYHNPSLEKIFEEQQTAGTARFETEYRVKDGTILPVEVNTHVVTIQGKKLMLGDVRDITERKRAEAAILQSEEKFRDIFNNTTDAIHIHGIGENGKPGRFTDVNDVACRMLGYTREELLAKTPLDIATGFHNPPIEQVFEEQRTTGTARFETEHRAKDGTVIPVEVNTHVVTIMGRNVMLGVVRDITERKKAEALLKHYSEDLEQEVKVRTEELSASLDEKVILLREIHHRVKNNLQIIISLVNLQMRQIDDKRLKQVMAETQNRVKAMSLVHEKLYQSEDISKIDLANYTRFLASQLFSFYGVDSRLVVLDVSIGKIMLDINTAIPFGLIINELASNALKHAFPNGKTGSLSITVREEKKILHLTVKDDGVGVPADFDWRNAESLGLRLVISLVDQLDGTIELDRHAGTAFTIIVKEKG
ncbi:MAG: PAS domain S-box protein [Methanoregula sp.]|jgi:PAS domain S-box-containing protein